MRGRSHAGGASSRPSRLRALEDRFEEPYAVSFSDALKALASQT